MSCKYFLYRGRMQFGFCMYVSKVGCPKMTQLLKCCAPDAFSGAKFQVFLENGHENDVG